MGRYATRRILQIIPLMLGISLIVFLIIQAAPGGPEGIMLQSGLMIDPQVIEAYRHRLGVDQPIYIQYFKWISAALSGDLGMSFTSARPVSGYDCGTPPRDSGTDDGFIHIGGVNCYSDGYL